MLTLHTFDNFVRGNQISEYFHALEGSNILRLNES
jgi:hypothetical protein